LNSQATAQSLETFAGIIGDVHGPAPRKAIAAIVKWLREKPKASVERRVAKLGENVDKLERAGMLEASLKGVRASLVDYRNIIEPGATATAKKAVNSLVTIVGDHTDMSIKSFIELLNSSGQDEPAEPPARSIDDYVRALKDGEKSPTDFEQVIADLKRDKSIRKAQLREIAEAFTGYKQTGTVKDLYEAILSPHKAYMRAKRQYETSSGKSAA
jgi:hypothetical protein